MTTNKEKVPSKEDVIIGQSIKHARLEKGFTRSAIAKELGISHQQLEKYETGRNRLSVKNLYILSKIYDLPIQYFTDYFDSQKKDKVSPGNKFIVKMNKVLNAIDDQEKQRIILKMAQIVKNGY